MLSAMAHLDLSALEARLDDVRASPSDGGRVELIVRRPAENEREVLDEGRLDARDGLVGDYWKVDSGDRDVQLTLINVRLARLVAGDDERVPLAGDQLYVDLSLAVDVLPPGTRLRVGEALVEVSAEPHRGCGKFASRFGVDALKFVNSKVGRELNLRGVNAWIVEGGAVRRGDRIVRAA